MIARLSLISICALMLACGAAQSATGSDERYPIVLDRHTPVGFRFSVEASYRSRMAQVVTVGNAPAENAEEENSSTFVADGEVLALRGDGEVGVVRYQVRALTRTEAGVARTLARPGSILEVHLGAESDEASATLDGAPVDAEALEWMGDVVTLTSNRHREEIFASPGPVRIGERWTPDMNAIVRAFASGGNIGMDAARASGTVTLAGRESVDGVLGLAIVGRVVADRMAVEMPEGTTVREAAMTLDFSGFFPDDPGLPPLRDEYGLEMHLVVDGPTPAGPMVMTMSAVSLLSRTLRPR